MSLLVRRQVKFGNSLLQPAYYLSKVCSTTIGDHKYTNQIHSYAKYNIISQRLELPSSKRYVLFSHQLLNCGTSTIFPQTTVKTRKLHTSKINYDKSKIEDTLKEKQRQKEKITVAHVTKDKVVVAKKPLLKRIWAEVLHYYHGFRLLALDIKIASKSLWKLFCGKSLTRREKNQFLRAVSDIFRLAPFMVFIIIPFAEAALPFVVKLFPSLLPSTFESSSNRETRLKKQLMVKLEMAKFMQDAVENIAIRSKKSSKKNESAKNFVTFMEKMRKSPEQPTNEDILKHAKLFEDEVTLDSMTRPQLIALCR